MGCHALLQEIFPTQGLNLNLLHLLHWQVGSLPLAPPEKTLSRIVPAIQWIQNIYLLNEWPLPPITPKLLPLQVPNLSRGQKQWSLRKHPKALLLYVQYRPTNVTSRQSSHAVRSSLPLTLFYLSSSLMKMTWKSHWSLPCLNKHIPPYGQILHVNLRSPFCCMETLRGSVFSRNKCRSLLRVQGLGPIRTLVSPPISLHLTHSQG